MRRFAGGFVALMLLTIIANACFSSRSASLNQWALFAIMVFGIPLLGMWATVELVLLVRPLRAFDATSRYPIYLPVLGVIAGVLTLALMGVQATFISRLLPDWLIALNSSVAATAIVVLLGCRRRKPGCCLRCGYDITHSLSMGRCPECGSVFVPPSGSPVYPTG